MSRIIYGVCGIGNGHIYRQVPVIEYLLKNNHTIVFFAYGNSFNYLSKNYSHFNNVKIKEVWNPYFMGDVNGINFKKSFEVNANNSEKYKLNLEAFRVAEEFIGIPDFVISDYEQQSAQYAYVHDVKLITIDQQSKFLSKEYKKNINNTSCQDEVMRLNMFFPRATRIACSFFKLYNHYYPDKNLSIVPSVLRKEISEIANIPNGIDYLVYLTADGGYEQEMKGVLDIFSKRKEKFHIFIQNKELKLSYNENIKIYNHGDKKFIELMSVCSGIICTAGHSLLSEAAFLNIPVYAIPLNLYEQQLNAKIFQDNGFGVMSKDVNDKTLNIFLKNVGTYRKNLRNDTAILFKENGYDKLIQKVEEILVQK